MLYEFNLINHQGSFQLNLNVPNLFRKQSALVSPTMIIKEEGHFDIAGMDPNQLVLATGSIGTMISIPMAADEVTDGTAGDTKEHLNDRFAW